MIIAKHFGMPVHAVCKLLSLLDASQISAPSSPPSPPSPRDTAAAWNAEEKSSGLDMCFRTIALASSRSTPGTFAASVSKCLTDAYLPQLGWNPSACRGP